MVRDSRIKEAQFSVSAISGAGSVTSNSDVNINGEILEVDWSTNRTGSIFLTFGATGEEFFRRNAPSGTGVQVTRPVAFQHLTTGGFASAGSPVTPFVTNDKVWLQYVGVASGASALSVNVRYR